MDGRLVEQITEQVMAALKGRETPAVRTWAQQTSTQPSAARAPQAVTPSKGGPGLVIYSGDAVPKAQERVHLLTSEASRISNSAAREAGYEEVHYVGDRKLMRELIESAAWIRYPVTAYSQLANLANLCDDCWEVRAALMALEAGRPVTVDTSALQPPAGLRERIESYIRDVRNYGFTVEGAFQPAPASSDTKPQQSFGAYSGDPGRFFPTSPQAASASPPAREPQGEVCLLKTTGECGGLGKCTRHLADRVKAIIDAGAARVSTTLGSGDAAGATAPFIDHTLLKADATREQVVQLCDEARKHSFASVCINPTHVKLAAEMLAGTPVRVCTVVGFPLGATTTVVKALETRDAIANGAQEIDMVINVGALKSGNYDLVRRDIEAVVEAARGALVKVILETALLTNEEKVRASQLSQEAGADFVKTSTGFGPGGATVEDVQLMRQTVGQFMGVKASGGIRDFATTQAMIAAGATRIGASASVAIVRGDAPKKGSGY